MKIHFKILLTLIFISAVLIDGVFCRRYYRRRRKPIGSYKTIGSIGAFFGFSSLIGYRYSIPFIKSNYVNRIVYGNISSEKDLIDVRENVKISENLSKNKTLESDSFYTCNHLYTKSLVQRCIEPENNTVENDFFWDGLCCEDTNTKSYLCCYVSLNINNSFSKANKIKWWLWIPFSRILYIFLWVRC
ncbi:unnamed protein product [Brachionus calyciflorus]|uniref:Uncharacterized protein n=1 Tax=Brachionus calyciflorus TaxID=104777 RepID=A0A813P4A2_9BILA|nr:unnamed protein product [Brachionus calyciflorus]